MTISNLRVDGARLWEALMEMARIGATAKGGVKRLALTDLDRQSRDLFARRCADAGLTMRVDAMGDMFARRAGADETLAPVVIGSHLDTQPTGGRFDGALGVIGALEAVRSLNDLKVRTRRPIEVVNWTNEEGSRFAPAMVSSAVHAGLMSLDEAYGRQDAEGRALGDELKRIGYAGAAPVGGRPFHALFELHIEQGPILEAEGVDIGVVTHGQGMKWYELTFVGFEAHAGSTPMARRRDALAAAARTIESVRAIALAEAPLGVGTTGVIAIEPGSRNVIPGRAFMTCEFRHPTGDALARMDAALRARIAEIAAQEKVSVEIAQVFDCPPTAFDAGCVAAVRRAADSLGLTHRDIVSGAGHDACNIARVAPTAMIFCPCVDGVSHNEAEDIKPKWAEDGANVLMRAALEAAEIVA